MQNQSAIEPASGGSERFSFKGAFRPFLFLAVILLTVVVLVLAYFVVKSRPSEVTPIASVSPLPEAKVSINSKGFIPATIKVKAGTKVIWKSEDAKSHQIASDPHPTHTSLPGLFSNALTGGESYSFTFEKEGTFTYHDHLNPLKLKGVVIVE